MKREILCKTAVVGAMVSMASLLVAGQASATYIRGAASVTASVPNGANDVSVINDQSGLSSKYINGVTDFDTYLSGGVTHDFNWEDNEWFAAEGTTCGFLTFDLGSVFTVDRFAFWNEDAAGIWAMGSSVSVSTDNLNWWDISSVFFPKDNTVDENYTADVFEFFGGPVATQYVRLYLLADPNPDNNMASTISVGEVAFSVAEPVPEPATMLLFGTGLVGIFGLRQRKKN